MVGEFGVNGCIRRHVSSVLLKPAQGATVNRMQDEYVNFALNIFLCALISHS